VPGIFKLCSAARSPITRTCSAFPSAPSPWQSSIRSNGQPSRGGALRSAFSGWHAARRGRHASQLGRSIVDGGSKACRSTAGNAPQSVGEWQDMNQVRFEGCDGIGTHEVGHYIVRELRIDPQTHWFNEFLASYVGYAYLKSKAPTQALSSEIFWTAGLVTHPILSPSSMTSKQI